MPVDIDRIQAILFDLDGTLRDTDDQWAARLARWITPVRFLLPNRDVADTARRVVMKIDAPGNAALHLADRLGLDDLAVHLQQRLHPKPADHAIVDVVGQIDVPAPIPGVADALVFLAARYPLALVSARGAGSAMHFLNGNHLAAFFKVIVTGQTTRRTKPYPDPVLWAASQLRLSPQVCLMVGDTAPDMLAGCAAGAQTLGVLCGFGDELELRAAGADEILPSTAQLPQLLAPPLSSSS